MGPQKVVIKSLFIVPTDAHYTGVRFAVNCEPHACTTGWYDAI